MKLKYMRRLKSPAVKDIDIDIANVLGQKYQYYIDIGKGDSDPPLIHVIRVHYTAADLATIIKV